MTKRTKRVDTDQPPRPPNAWILYRSEKMRERPPLPHGVKGPIQADISKELSRSWKEEPQSVRAHYEALAETKKKQHLMMYPDYQFKPMKKEDKIKLREQKKAEKDRAKEETKRQKPRYNPYPTATLVPTAHVPYYAPGGNYGSDGPSPPLSAASLPSGSSTPSTSSSQLPPDSFRPQSAQLSTQNADSLPLYPTTLQSIPSSRQTSLTGVFQRQLYATAPSPAQTSQSDATWVASQTPDGTSFDASPDASSQAESSQQWLFDSSTPASAGPATPWNFDNDAPVPAGAGMSTSWSITTPPPSVPLTPISLHMPTPSSMLNTDWLQNLPEDDPLHAMAMATQDPSIFQLSGFDESMLMAEPPAEINISMPSDSYLPQPNPDITAAFARFLEELNSQTVSLQEPLHNMDHLLYTAEDRAEDEADARALSDASLLQYLDLDFTPIPEEELQQLPRHVSPLPSAPSTSRYVPPAGAANNSLRRVAGSWKPAHAMMASPPQSPIQQGSAAPWQFH